MRILSLFVQSTLSTWALIILFFLIIFISIWLVLWSYLVYVLLFISIYRTVYIIITSCINLLQSALLNWPLLSGASLILLFHINVRLTFTCWVYVTTTLELIRLLGILRRLHFLDRSINQGNLLTITASDHWYIEVIVLWCHSTL